MEMRIEPEVGGANTIKGREQVIGTSGAWSGWWYWASGPAYRLPCRSGGGLFHGGIAGNLKVAGGFRSCDFRLGGCHPGNCRKERVFRE
jgi:hypothetical protein